MTQFLRNRIRTIVGADSGFFKSLFYLFYYIIYQLLFGRVFSRLMQKFFTGKVNYQSWLTSRIRSGVTAHNRIQLIQGSDKVNPDFEYILLTNPGDRWRADAVYLLNQTIVNQEFPDLITFSYDITDATGSQVTPQFNPSWSPHALLSGNYLQNAFCAKSGLFNKGLPLLAEEQYEWLCGLNNQTLRMFHLQEVLLHKTKKVQLAKQTYQANNIQVLISIIIPTRNMAEMVKQCIDSVIHRSTYSFYEIILVDNQSNEKTLEDLLASYKVLLKERFKIVRADFDFNFSKLINLGAANASGDYFVFLNNDTSIITPDWMERLMSKFQIKHTGAVGAKLLYPDSTVQHAGIALDERIISKHIYLGRAAADDAVIRDANLLAVTAACMMVSRTAFDDVNGFDSAFAVNFNDIDFCLRLYQKKYVNVYAADVELFHYESASRQHPFANWRSSKNYRKESKLMRKNWSHLLSDDPYFSALHDRFQV